MRNLIKIGTVEVSIHAFWLESQLGNLRDRGDHLGSVSPETARCGQVCPVEVFLNSKTKPQETGLK